MYHMFSEVEVRYDEPHEQNDGAKAQEVERHPLEERHIKHVREAADAVIVPLLENKIEESYNYKVLNKELHAITDSEYNWRHIKPRA